MTAQDATDSAPSSHAAESRHENGGGAGKAASSDAALRETDPRAITRKSRSNLAFALSCLPPERRQDMVSFYAFCRVIDDIADDPAASIESRRQELSAWKTAITTGDGTRHPVLAETILLIQKYHLDIALLLEIIDGVAADLDRDRYETMADLLGYCYKVASAVGLVSIEIFGYTRPACKDYAVNLGYALQLTNVLRDVGQDARDTRRIYLPLEDLRRHGVTEQQILDGRYDAPFAALMAEMHDRARAYYSLARSQLPSEDEDAMLAARMMAQIYGEILEKLRQKEFRVFEKRVRLSRPRMAFILARYLLRGWLLRL